MIVRKALGVAALTVLTLFAVQSLSAQNLMDNEEMRQSREYEQLAEQALNEGEYEQAIEYSELAEEYAERGRETAERQALSYRANSLRNRAESRLYYAERIGVPNRDADAFSAAQDAFGEAVSLLDENEFTASIEKSREVLSLLEDFQPRRFTAEQPDEEPKLPKYYIVRLIPERRDSFWRIAEYEFVYDDPWLWPRLYEKNKDILHDPENPDLIHPGMQFEIPARNGEVREGIQNPEDAIEGVTGE